MELEEEIEAALRRGMRAVLELAESYLERALRAEPGMDRARLLRGAAECYLAVGRSIPTPRHEVALLTTEMGRACLRAAAAVSCRGEAGRISGGGAGEQPKSLYL
ncbi:MAG: hypothetical protein GXO66_06915 [Euryarchaeota archaeon]|nr:hypothetical protein [Euryarchaeota archaeon]